MTACCTLYVTVPTKAEAVTLSRTLLAEKLIACANISGDILSLYVWEGTLCEEGEVALLLKTRTDISDKTIQRIKELHSYDTPCIVRWDITGGDQDYLNWIEVS
ncbi:MAG: divalent-cation tolerance protein CutA [Emcibacter sp.]|nr:divalent-cation tolerance protein CutA [Emcibacter sp.]